MSRAPVLPTHREVMSHYYGFQSAIYDATRWMFLFDRQRIVRDLTLRPGETVLEIGCGTGHNFRGIRTRVGDRGRVIAVDCSGPMLKQAGRRIARNSWKNFELIDHEYGGRPLNQGQVDAVLMSYSLSMIPNWQNALRTAKAELKPGGRIGIVDFYHDGRGKAAGIFAGWLQFNHVEIDRPFENVVMSMFEPATVERNKAFGGLWRYFRFIGFKKGHSGNLPRIYRNERTSA